MTRISTIIRNVCLSASLLSVPAVWADQVKVGDFYYELTDSTKTAVLAMNADYKTMAEVNVPGTIAVDGVNYTVTEIGEKAFYGCEMTKLTVGEGVVKISKGGFSKCAKLVDVSLPSTLTTILNDGFWACTKIEVLVLPDNLMEIGADGFCSLTSLTEVTLPANMTKLGSTAFSGCSKLTKVNFGKALTEITGSAFRRCGFETITLPESLKILGTGVFNGCASLTEVILPKGLEQLGDQTFYECAKLTNVAIPDSVKRFGNGTFYGCKSIKSITFPKSLSSIDQNCFYGCESLNNVKWPANITTIPYAAFYNCVSLDNIEIPATVNSIGEFGFYNSGLKSIKIPDGVTTISKSCFSYCASLKTIEIPNSVTTIENNAFHTSGIEKLNIPASVTSISWSTVNSCNNLQAIEVDPANPNYASIDGALYNKNITTLLAYPCGKKGVYVMPETVTVFDGPVQTSPNITGVVFSKSLKEITGSMFYKCTNITELEFPDSLENIGSTCFWFCTGLKSVKLPNRQVYIGNNAFSATALENFVVPENFNSIGIDKAGTAASIMASCQSLQWISLPSTLTLFRPFAASCNNLKTIYSFATVPATVNAGTAVTVAVTIKVPKGTAAAYEAAWKSSYPNAKFEDVLPNGVTANMADGTVSLNWEAYSDGVYTGTPVNYVVTLKDGNDNVLTENLSGDKVSGTNLSASFTGLTGTSYTYEVKGYSSIGQLTVYHTGEINASTTGIDEVGADDVVSEVYYDLTGRVVANPVAGNIYVVKKAFANGRTAVAKIMMK